jgi:Uma2 family endonuclease
MSKPLPERRMTSEEFLTWAQSQEEGRFELHDGQIIAMSPERAEHVEIKFNVTSALKLAIGRAGLPCFAYIDGLAVRIDATTTFEPDAQVVCGEKVPSDAVAASNPVIVVEILSPSTGYKDLGPKVEGYFRVASIRHYLIVDPEPRRIIHHRRGDGEALETRIIASGVVRLDPPGSEISAEDVFAGLA